MPQPQPLIITLQEAARQAAVEASAAATRQQETETALASAVSAAEEAAKRRRVLDDAVMQAQAAEDSSRDRLGSARLELGGTLRQIEAAADRAANGDDAAGKSVIRLTDTRQLQEHLVLAHEKKTAVAAAAREAAETELQDHDAAVALSEQASRERLLAHVGAAVDRRLAEATAAATTFRDVMEDARSARTPEGWKPLYREFPPFDSLVRAAQRIAAPLETAFAVHGPMVGRAFPTFTRLAEDALASWRQARGEPEPITEEAA